MLLASNGLQTATHSNYLYQKAGIFMLSDKGNSDKPVYGTVKPYRGLDGNHRAFLDFHRSLGASYPATDLDSVLLEYNYANPAAICELKSEQWKPDLTTWNFKAIINLSNMANLPGFAIQANNALSHFNLWSLNHQGQAFIGNHAIMTVQEYTEFLDDLRRKNGK